MAKYASHVVSPGDPNICPEGCDGMRYIYMPIIETYIKTYNERWIKMSLIRHLLSKSGSGVQNIIEHHRFAECHHSI